MSWPDRARAMIGHWMSEPFYRFFSLMPGWEVGLSDHEVSKVNEQHHVMTGRRAVHLSDLHLDHYLPRHDTILTTVRQLSPHWIFVTGDLLNVPEGLPNLFRFLTRLRGIAPVFVTLGNHDHYSGVPIDEYSELADRYKITLLVNQSVFIPTTAGELAVVGVDDPSLHRADLDCIPPLAENRYTLLLAHAPNILDQLEPDHHVDLILCGHSHGGQWRFAGIPTFWLPPGCSGRIEGEHVKSEHRLYVNRGLGWSFLPFRFNCRPEIVLIEWS
ncbi:MAG TPA: metallophosphoesterase [Nitrospiraceae bacterium]